MNTMSTIQPASATCTIKHLYYYIVGVWPERLDIIHMHVGGSTSSHSGSGLVGRFV